MVKKIHNFFKDIISGFHNLLNLVSNFSFTFNNWFHSDLLKRPTFRS